MAGVVTQKANRKAVDTQLMLVSEVLKYWAEVFDTGAKAIQSQETTMLSRQSCARPKKRRLYTLYSVGEDVEILDIVRVGARDWPLEPSSAKGVEESREELPA